MQNVFEGVTGVVTQPVKGTMSYIIIIITYILLIQWVTLLIICPSGLQKEGAIGLLQGTGRGLVGLITRPTGGLMDLASGTLDFVTR